jgi:hypothetical protein
MPPVWREDASWGPSSSVLHVLHDPGRDTGTPDRGRPATVHDGMRTGLGMASQTTDGKPGDKGVIVRHAYSWEHRKESL